MENRTVIEWDKTDCEEMGLVKVDLLGLGHEGIYDIRLAAPLDLVFHHRGHGNTLAAAAWAGGGRNIVRSKAGSWLAAIPCTSPRR